MKSNHERSNECLPPKKREILASTLPSEERPMVMAPANASQRSGNLAWLASLASGHDRERQHTSTSSEPYGPQYKPLSAMAESIPPSSTHLSRAPTAVTSIPAVYTSPLSYPDGTIQYTPLPPNFHFISSPYSAPYAGYISPLVPPSVTTTTTTTQREIYASTYSSSASKIDQHHQLGRPPSILTTDNTSSPHSTQYIQIAGSPLSLSPRTAPSPHAHLPPHLHPHHTLPISGPTPVFHITHTDGPLSKREETRPREVLNGELEKDRRFGPSPESSVGKQGSTAKGGSSTQQHQIYQQQSPRHYEARHVVLPAEYAQDSAAMRTSLVLVPNSHGSGGADPRGTPDKLPPPTSHTEKGGICAGKPVSRSSSSSASRPFPPPPVDSLKGAVTTLSPHAVIQTTHNTTESLSLGLPSTNFYSAQQPIIGYIAGTGHQQPLSYHTSISQHLVIPGTQPVIIPVSGTEATATSTTLPLPAVLSQAFVTSMAPKSETFEAPAPYTHPATAVVQTQLHLPVVPAPAGGLLRTLPPPSVPSLPAYFAKGSIIQLADGELKRVEDLKTEDFIQSAEISNELMIDSSTVERIDSSHTSNSAIIQFAVGEHHSQVG